MFREEIEKLLLVQEENYTKNENDELEERDKRITFHRKCNDLDEDALYILYEIYKNNIKNAALISKPMIHSVNKKPMLYIGHPVEGPAENKIKAFLERDGFAVCDAGGVCMPRGFSIQCL